MSKEVSSKQRCPACNGRGYFRYEVDKGQETINCAACKGTGKITNMKLPPSGTLNPNNPVARASFDNWHKIAALIMHKCGVKHLELKSEDIDALNASCANIGIADDKGYIEIFLLTPEETAKALKKHGGAVDQS